MNEENENIVSFEDENGEIVNLEVVDYFFYDGQEYVILADADEDGCGCEACGDEACECDDSEVDVYVMKVENLDEEDEEFLPVDPELEPEVLAYAERFLNGEFDEEDDEDEDDMEEYEEDEDKDSGDEDDE